LLDGRRRDHDPSAPVAAQHSRSSPGSSLSGIHEDATGSPSARRAIARADARVSRGSARRSCLPAGALPSLSRPPRSSPGPIRVLVSSRPGSCTRASRGGFSRGRPSRSGRVERSAVRARPGRGSSGNSRLIGESLGHGFGGPPAPERRGSSPRTRARVASKPRGSQPRP